MSSSVHFDNMGQDILIPGEGSTKGSYGTTFTAEAKYLINFMQSTKIFVLSLHYNGSNNFCLLMLQKYINSKQKNSEIKDYALCLGNFSKYFTINEMKKTGLKGVLKSFFVYFNRVLILTIF